jgi:HlyD family secretion protein
MRTTMLARVILSLAAVGALSAFVLRARAREGGRADVAPPTAAATVPLVRAEGRLVGYPDADVTVGTDLKGIVARVYVDEGVRVRRGDRLVELDASEQRAALAEARARSVEAEADLRLSETDVQRVQALKDQALVSQQSLDRAVRDRDAARAQVAEAQASVQRLEAVVRKSVITAPIDGVVIERPVEVGQVLTEGAAVARVADLKRTRIEAEVDEFDAGSAQVGAPVRVTAEGYAGQSWAGRVEEIPDAVQGRRLKPQDPGRPQDTRVLLVKIALDAPTPLRLGQRVEVEITSRPVTPQP